MNKVVVIQEKHNAVAEVPQLFIVAAGQQGPSSTSGGGGSGGPVAWDDISGKPIAFPPSAHSHDGIYDPAGTAASAVGSHEAATDPHPQYLTQAEGDLRYDTSGAATSAVGTHESGTGVHAIASVVGLQTALDAKISATEKGTANGVTPLDATGKVAAAYLPSYVDDVVESANFAALPGTGEVGKIYVTLDDNKTYRWSGSAYVEISASPGSTDAVAEGATNLYFTTTRVRSAVLTGLSVATNAVITATDSVLTALGKLQAQITGHVGDTTNPHSVTKAQVGLGNVDNTSDLSKPISTATQTALSGKSDTTHNHDATYEPKNTNIQAHISSTANPHSVTKAQVGLGNVDNTSDANKPISTAVQTALDQKQAVVVGGFTLRNLVINGAFTVNQRVVSGTVTLAAGAYGHDRWKAGASGCTYTFATSNGLTTITITAGSLQQVIEDKNIPTGTNTLVMSWTGTAQGKIGAGSYSASGVTASVTGGSSLTVEFGTGTLTKVQLELGSTPTSFEFRPYGSELSLCQRYYQRMSGANYTAFGSGSAGSVTSAEIHIRLGTPMRVAPILGFSNIALNDGVNAVVAVTGFNSGFYTTDSLLAYPTVASGLTQYRPYRLVANNNAAGYIDLSAEL